MVYHGTVRGGKIELDDAEALPEGARVQVELTAEEWMRRWDELSREISKKWKSPLSAVELLSEMRR